MGIFEYDQEAHMKLIRREGYEAGITDGIAQGTAESMIAPNGDRIRDGSQTL